MNVMNRKLFSDRQARKRLRDMGGIMSSFPELAGEVQRFQAGGEVTYSEWQNMSRIERQRAGLPLSTIGGNMYFNRFGVGMGLNDPETGERLYEASGVSRRDTRGEAAPYTPEEVEAASAGGRDRGDRRNAPAADQSIEAAAEITDDMVDAAENAAQNVEPDELETLRTDYEALLAENQRLLSGEEDPSAEDLESLAQRRIELYQRLFGEDEPTPRDKGMQLAMIGLAIAAGQSPDAISNIASGALAGLQAMSAQEAARRDRARELRTSAIGGVIRERSEAREDERAALERKLEEYRAGRQQVIIAALGDAGASGITDAAEAYQYAETMADQWARSNYPDLVGAPAAAPTTEAPSAAPLRARNPTTGETVIFRDGQWVPE